MGEWKKRTLKMNDSWGWNAKPGYNIFALGRGDIRFEYPHGWIVEPAKDDVCIKLHDKKPPDDDCTLAVSCVYLKPGIDWSELPVGEFVLDGLKHDRRNPYFTWNKTIEFSRPRVRAAWAESRFIDPIEHREAHSRTCRALYSNILALITFDYWDADAPKMTPVWDNVMASIVMGDYVEDPRMYRKD